MHKITMKVMDKDYKVKAEMGGYNDVCLQYQDNFQEGDMIILECNKNPSYLVIQLDETIGECIVYLATNIMAFEVPLRGNKKSYAELNFLEKAHSLYARVASNKEIKQYRNLALNKYDHKSNFNCYPHVEIVNESVVNSSKSHYITNSNSEECIELNIRFGRKVSINKLVFHKQSNSIQDSFWLDSFLKFSDNSKIKCDLVKTEVGQVLTFQQREVEWIRLCKFIKKNDDFHAFDISNIEVYGVSVI
ncbi:MAG TPA: hypothetical protein DHW61_11035 [Lachnoclostridium phytofermentans]|uniref:Uncharacterized protein n=1 Tax=Lachnoclostridium phytofermentans TaxID=66219 RepID=A0A3D2X8R5_9FIRM|nr:hypothetical protein [Lachnoclostridium sp.]HCL02925.1 hypothetical protein [Lachnoclostridium phytofermentans]